eukprot:2530680-Amphidinium_carterae.1
MLCPTKRRLGFGSRTPAMQGGYGAQAVYQVSADTAAEHVAQHTGIHPQHHVLASTSKMSTRIQI